MPYDVERNCEELAYDAPFQAIERILGINISAEARDPLDHTSFVIPAGTPMAAIHQAGYADEGLWLPIRRSQVTDVPDATHITVADASPFKAGDTIQSIDVTGPATGGGVALGQVVAVDYTTNIITVAASAGVAATDWIECYENGAADLTRGEWVVPKAVGVLRDPVDMRVTASDTTGTLTTAEVVVEGAIEEGALNFPVAATTDLILVPELSLWNPASGGVQIITRPHGAVAVDVPDMV